MEITEEEKQKELNKSWYCPIWFELMAEPVTTPCQHSFWFIWFCDKLEKNSFTWPTCRASFEELYVPDVDKELQSEIAKQKPEEFKQISDQLKLLGCWKGDLMSFKFFYGNYHRYLTTEEVEEESKISHEWSMYVECSRARLTKKFISNVEFKLHPTFSPSRVIVGKAPFQIRRWGSSIFEVKITIHWSSWLNRDPSQYSHMLNFEGNGKRNGFIVNVNKDDYNNAN